MSDHDHEIGNVLGILIGNAQMLVGEDLGDEAKEMAEDILTAAIRLGRLLRPIAEAR